LHPLVGTISAGDLASRILGATLTAAPAKVTPLCLEAAERACPRWLACEIDERPGTRTAFNRWRIRNALLARANAAHRQRHAPRPEDFGPPSNLLPEEAAIFMEAGAGYLRHFGGQEVQSVARRSGRADYWPKRNLTVGGAIDLLVEQSDGHLELRQLELWGGAVCADPTNSAKMLCAVLRLASMASGRRLRVRHVDLLGDDADECEIDWARDLPRLATMLDERVAVVRDRARSPLVQLGQGCAMCRHAEDCPGHRSAGIPAPPTDLEDVPRDDLVGDIVRLSPTAVENWYRCHRAFRARHLLSLPSTDPGPGGANEGLLVHRLLYRLHREERCGDQVRMADLAESHAAGEGVDAARTLGFLDRHARRCPRGAAAVGHERELARAWFGARPLLMVTGTIDAIWSHDTLLDARDYKCGMPQVASLRESAEARVQAWLLAPLAHELGLQLRLRHEHLSAEATEDPDPFEPDAEDLEEISAELVGLCAAIGAEREWRGASAEPVCRTCAYRSVCPDDASRGVGRPSGLEML
jgi:RecB family exonuclease